MEIQTINQTGDTTMFSKIKIALSAALILGTASVALAANEHDDSVSEREALQQHGNPLPWWWNAPVGGRAAGLASAANAGSAYGYLASQTTQGDHPRKKTHNH
jgi:hypothetical protein